MRTCRGSERTPGAVLATVRGICDQFFPGNCCKGMMTGRQLLVAWVWRAILRTAVVAGTAKLARIAMMAMTTSSSMSVNPRLRAAMLCVFVFMVCLSMFYVMRTHGWDDRASEGITSETESRENKKPGGDPSGFRIKKCRLQDV